MCLWAVRPELGFSPLTFPTPRAGTSQLATHKCSQGTGEGLGGVVPPPLSLSLLQEVLLAGCCTYFARSKGRARPISSSSTYAGEVTTKAPAKADTFCLHLPRKGREVCQMQALWNERKKEGKINARKSFGLAVNYQGLWRREFICASVGQPLLRV